MFRTCVVAGSMVFFVAACVPSNNEDLYASKAFAPIESASHPAAKARRQSSDSVTVPTDINIASAAGEVAFRHQMHISDLAIKCVECHHQIDAKPLDTPHPDYLQSSWINCKTCHSESGSVKKPVYACSACHHVNPVNIADETLSAKVVIHKQCLKCHPVGTGSEASKSCEKCHSGERTF